MVVKFCTHVVVVPQICALRVTDGARRRILKAGGQVMTFDQLALASPKGHGTVLLSGNVSLFLCFYFQLKRSKFSGYAVWQLALWSGSYQIITICKKLFRDCFMLIDGCSDHCNWVHMIWQTTVISCWLALHGSVYVLYSCQIPKVNPLHCK